MALSERIPVVVKLEECQERRNAVTSGLTPCADRAP